MTGKFLYVFSLGCYDFGADFLHYFEIRNGVKLVFEKFIPRRQLGDLLHRLKVSYLDYAGEEFKNVSVDLFYNEEVGLDVLLPLDIIESLAQEIPQDRIRLEHVVRRIEWSNQGGFVTCVNGKKIDSDYVISTLPVRSLFSFFN